MKLRGKRTSSRKDSSDQAKPEPKILKRSKKTSNKVVRKEVSKDSSSSISRENSKVELEQETRFRPKLRNIDLNFPGKYKKMNSGKFLFKSKKPEKRPSLLKKKPFRVFNIGTVKIMLNFFNKLCDIDFERVTSSKKKKVKKIDQITMKLLSDDVLSTNLNQKCSVSQEKGHYINNSIFHANNKSNMKGKLEGVQMISNPYYNFKFNYSAQGIQVSNPSFSGQYGQGQNRTMRKFFEQSVYTGGDHSNYPNHPDKTLSDCNLVFPNPNNIDKNNFLNSEFNNLPQKEIINKNTPNHVSVANYIKSAKEEALRDNSSLNYNNHKENCLSSGPNLLTAVKSNNNIKESHHHSTESEKSEERGCSNSGNKSDQPKATNSCSVSKTFPLVVEDLTKNQLDQIKEIFKAKVERETSITSRKNSEKI